MLASVNFLELLITAVKVLVNLHLFLVCNQPSQRIVCSDEVEGDCLGLSIQRREANGCLVFLDFEGSFELASVGCLKDDLLSILNDAPDLFLVDSTDHKLELVGTRSDDHAGLSGSRKRNVESCS